MLESSWSLRIKLPQTKGATFAGQCSANQHDLRHLDQAEVSFQEILNAALQQGHVFGQTPI